MGATVHELGRKYQPWVNAFPVKKSVKHIAAKSVNRSILKKSRPLAFGVFIVCSSMAWSTAFPPVPAWSLWSLCHEYAMESGAIIFLCHQCPCMQHYISMLASPPRDTKYWHIPQTLAYFASLPLFLVFHSFPLHLLSLSFPSSIVVYVSVFPFLVFIPFLSIYYPFPFLLLSSFMC